MPELINRKQAATILNVLPSSIPNLAKNHPDFPKPVKIGIPGGGKNRRNVTLWRASAIQAWYDNQPKDADGKIRRRRGAKATDINNRQLNNKAARQFVTGF